MDIVKGRGNHREVVTFPCAHFVHNSSNAEKKAAKNLLCNLLGIDPNSNNNNKNKKKVA